MSTSRAREMKSLLPALHAGEYDVEQAAQWFLHWKDQPHFHAMASRALAAGHVQLFEKLRQQGAQLQAITDAGEDFFPLQGAAWQEVSTPPLHAVLSHYTHPDVRWRVDSEWGAKRAGLDEVVRYMLKHYDPQMLGIDRTYEDVDHPVAYLTRSISWRTQLPQYCAALECLIQAGADVDHHALKCPPFEEALDGVSSPWSQTICEDVLPWQDRMLQMLLYAGARWEDSVVAGLPALHMAMHKGLVGTVNVLLEKGAPLWAKNVEGQTAVEMLRTQDHMLPLTQAILQALHERGEDLHGPLQAQALAELREHPAIDAQLQGYRLQRNTQDPQLNRASRRL